jgi:hypothetical protein
VTRAPADVGPVLNQVPWRDAKVALVAVTVDGGGLRISYAKSLEDKRRLLDAAGAATRLLVCWPGAWSQDIFELGDLGDRVKVRRWLGPDRTAVGR